MSLPDAPARAGADVEDRGHARVSRFRTEVICEVCGKVLYTVQRRTGMPAVREDRCMLHRERKIWGPRYAVAVCLLLCAVPVSAQPSKWISDVAVWSAIGLDTRAQVRSDEQRAALTCEAMRMSVTLGAAELTKRIVRRERPDRSDRKSFYSMHTAMAAQAAGWRYEIGIPVAVLTGWGRVQAKKHYWSDVAVGMIAGLAASRLCGVER